MKVLHKDDLESDFITEDIRQKVALLNLVPVGQYLMDIGLYDGQYYVLSENKDDNMFLLFDIQK